MNNKLKYSINIRSVAPKALFFKRVTNVNAVHVQFTPIDKRVASPNKAKICRTALDATTGDYKSDVVRGVRNHPSRGLSVIL